MYGSETLTMTVIEEEWLRGLKRQVFRHLFGAVKVQGAWRIRMSAEIQQIYGPDIITDIKESRIRWAGMSREC